MKKLTCFFLVIVLVICVTACNEKSIATADDEIPYDIESDIEFVKNIFACVNAEFLTEALGEDVIVADIGLIKGSFAGIKGRYEVTFYGENDDGFEPDNIYTVKFVWDSNQIVSIEDVVADMTQCLGDYENNFDKDWEYYCWHGREETRFSDSSFANCFDIEIFGDNGYIVFGMYTIS